MKKFFFIALFFSLVIFSFGQNPDWLWANSAGGTNYDWATAVCTDLSGNVYVTGYFRSPSVTFGSTVLTNSSGSGNDDIFFVKYDANGNVLWAKKIGGNGTDDGYACTADAYGDVYLMGYFAFDTLILGTDTLFNYSMFLAKYDSSGNEIWARATDAGHTGRTNGMSVDSLGYIYLTGTFTDTVSFGGHVIYGSGEEMFLVKYAPNGNVLWASSAGGTNNTEGGIACAADNKGNIYVTGIFENHYMYIGTDTLTNFNAAPCFDSVYCPDIFIARYDSSGNFIWAKSAGGNDFDNVRSITTDTAGNVFIAGGFSSSSITFGPYTFNNPYQTLPYIYVAKYDSSGNVLWADAPTSTNDESECRNITADRSGNIYMTGYFNGGTITFGTITLSRIYNGDADLYVVKYNTSGTAIWATRVGNPNMFEDAYGIAVAPNSDCYITGAFWDSIPVQFGNNNISGFGLTDMFLAKVGESVGIEENIYSADLNIFPNPTNGNVKIICSRDIDEIKITDVLGQVIYAEQVKKNYLPLHLRNSGIFFITIKSGSGVATRKLIVSK